MSNNKERIKKLRDCAELAWAAYGYFHLVNKNYKHNDKDKKRLEHFPKLLKHLGEEKRDPTYADILDITYKYYLDDNGKPKDGFFDDRLFDGDFSPLQAQRFFSRYDLLIHQPNTESGFSATLFGEKTKQKNTESKEISYTSEYGYINYTLAIRGTKPSDTGDLKTDARMALGYIPQGQYNDMLRFYNQCKAKYPAMTESKSLNIVGHSLGGALTQMLVLSICDDKNEANINEVYTFNSHLESKKAA